MVQDTGSVKLNSSFLRVAESVQTVVANGLGNLGATNAKRDNGDETSGFSGDLNWFVNLSSLSKFEISISSDLPDMSSEAFSTVGRL